MLKFMQTVIYMNFYRVLLFRVYKLLSKSADITDVAIV